MSEIGWGDRVPNDWQLSDLNSRVTVYRYSNKQAAQETSRLHVGALCLRLVAGAVMANGASF